MERDFRVGAVLSRSLSVLFANFLPFLTIAGIVALPVIALQFYERQLLETGQRDGVVRLLTVVLQVMLNPLVTAALTYGVLQDLRNQRASFVECLQVGFARLLPVLAVAIVVGLATGVGFLLLVIPGLWVLARLWVAIPVAVVERPGISGSLRRSEHLTEGSRWPILGLWILVFIISTGLGFIVGLIVGVAQNATITFIAVTLLSVFTSAWQASVQAVSYYTLRSMKEMIDVDQIAAVFD